MATTTKRKPQKQTMNQKVTEWLKAKTRKFDEVMRVKAKIDKWVEEKQSAELQDIDAQIQELQERKNKILGDTTQE